MNISMQWLRTFIALPETAAQVAALLTGAGLEVEEVVEYESLPGGLKGVVIGRVMQTVQHPNADRLKICRVDVGGGQMSQIVCGAANVTEGQKVLVALPGAVLHPTAGGIIEIKKSKIRGEESAGMICAEDELGLGASHEGILVLDTHLVPGTPAARYFNTDTDNVITIGLTPNRGDAASHLGVARDLSALLNRDLHEELRYLSQTPLAAYASTGPYQITIEPGTGALYIAAFIEDVKVGPSPEWLQQRLKAIGLSPINNVVDLTNYLLHGLGQPAHAFDADKLSGHQLAVRRAGTDAGSTFTSLDKKQHTLDVYDLVIADAGGPIALAGVMGGRATAVSETTTRVLLELASFDPVAVRQTSARHGIKTDASFRFERGTWALLPFHALKAAEDLLAQLAMGRITAISHSLAAMPEERLIYLPLVRLNTLVGQTIDEEMVIKILTRLGFRVEADTQYGHAGFAEGLNVTVPGWRLYDVEGVADLVEEVIRIYGFNNIALPRHVRVRFFDTTPGWRAFDLQAKVGNLLAARGLVEVLNNSITSPTRQLGGTELVHLLNPLSEELSQMRSSLLTGLLTNIAYNANRRAKTVRIFEYGRTYRPWPDGRANPATPALEVEQLALAAWGQQAEETWSQKNEPTTLAYLAADVTALLKLLGLEVRFEKSDAEYGLTQGAMVKAGKRKLGYIGLVPTEAAKTFDVKGPVYAALLDWQQIENASPQQREKMQEPPKFPEVRRDLSLVLDTSVTYDQLQQLAFETERKLLKSINLFDVFEDKSLGASKKAYALSFTLQADDATLTEQQIDKTMHRLEQAFVNSLGATLRR